MRWHGRASGVDVSSPVALVATVRERRIIRLKAYLSHRQALEAVGLRE